MPNADGSPTINEIISMAGSLSAIKANNLKTEQALNDKAGVNSALNLASNGYDPTKQEDVLRSQGYTPEAISALNLKGNTNKIATQEQSNIGYTPSQAIEANKQFTANIENQQKQQAMADDDAIKSVSGELSAQMIKEGTPNLSSFPESFNNLTKQQQVQALAMSMDNAIKHEQLSSKLNDILRAKAEHEAKLAYGDMILADKLYGRGGVSDAADRIVIDRLNNSIPAYTAKKNEDGSVDLYFNDPDTHEISGHVKTYDDAKQMFDEFVKPNMKSEKHLAAIFEEAAKINTASNIKSAGGERYYNPETKSFITISSQTKNGNIDYFIGNEQLDGDMVAKYIRENGLISESAYYDNLKKTSEINKNQSAINLNNERVNLVGAQTNQAITAAGLNNAKIQTEKGKPARDADKSDKRAIAVDNAISKLKREKLEAYQDKNPDKAKVIQDNISRLASELKTISPERYHRQFGKSKAAGSNNDNNNKFNGLF